MACRAGWNITSDESFYSDALPKIDFMHLTKELENTDAECIYGKFSEDETGEVWIKHSSCSGNPGLYRSRERRVSL